MENEKDISSRCVDDLLEKPAEFKEESIDEKLERFSMVMDRLSVIEKKIADTKKRHLEVVGIAGDVGKLKKMADDAEKFAKNAAEIQDSLRDDLNHIFKQHIKYRVRDIEQDMRGLDNTVSEQRGEINFLKNQMDFCLRFIRTILYEKEKLEDEGSFSDKMDVVGYILDDYIEKKYEFEEEIYKNLSRIFSKEWW